MKAYMVRSNFLFWICISLLICRNYLSSEFCPSSFPLYQNMYYKLQVVIAIINQTDIFFFVLNYFILDWCHLIFSYCTHEEFIYSVMEVKLPESWLVKRKFVLLYPQFFTMCFFNILLTFWVKISSYDKHYSNFCYYRYFII